MLMNAQRKRIQSSRQAPNTTENAITIVAMDFDDDAVVNVHGVNVSIGMTPQGPDETLIGRWYVVMLPASIVHDSTVLNAWIANLNTVTLANLALASSEFVWGAGSIVCGEQSTFQHTFSPKTSRNVKKGGSLRLILVADAISGVIDDWDGAGTISLFSS